MGDSSCLVEDLSDAPDHSSRESEVNVASALRESVSFGRFFSESLDWGKWSSFCQKRYLEEAEKYSTPGSVAQRKAFFEAHYKRAAARKSASALPEQADSMESNAESNVGYCSSNLDAKSESEEFSVEEVEVQAIDKENILDGEKNGVDKGKVENGGMIMEERIVAESTLQIESLEIFGGAENQNKFNVLELNRSNLSDKKPLEEISVINQENIGSIEKKTRTPNLKSSVPKLPRPTPSPSSRLWSSQAKSVSSFHCLKENKSTPITEKGRIESHERKKSNPRSLHRSVNFTQSQSGSVSPLTDQTLPTMKKTAESKVNISLQARGSGSMSPLNNQTSPTMKKAADSKVLSSLQTCQNRLPYVRTSSRLASSNGVSKLALLSRQSEDGRIRSPLKQTPSGSQRDVKTYSVRYSLCPDSQGSGKRTEAASFSLSFKTNERVEKKEVSRNLEYKANSRKKVKKVQLQEIPEENAESEIKKLRRSLCFKARPLPDFYRNIELLKHGKRKIPSTLTESLTLGKNNSKAKSDPNSLPPVRRSVISGRSMQIRKNSSKNSSSSVTWAPNKHK